MIRLCKFGKAMLTAAMSKGVQNASVQNGGGSSSGGRPSYSDTEITVALTSMVGAGMRNMARFCMCPERRNAKFHRSWIRRARE